MKISLSINDLRAIEGSKADAFQDYLKEKLPKDVKINTGEPLEFESGEGLKNAKIRLLSKKFLARERLQDDLRVVVFGENLAIKNRKKKRI